MIGERKTTLLPRHIKQLGKILGIPDAAKGRMNLPNIAHAPIIRHLRAMGPPNNPLRMSKESVTLRLPSIEQYYTYGVQEGWQPSRNGIQIRKSDIDNVGLICNDFPR